MCRTLPILLMIFAILAYCAPPISAHNCAKCHIENDVTVKIPATAPIKLVVDNSEKEITLADAFKFHGHECPGTATAFRAVQYGIELLYGDRAPSRDDLLIFSKHPSRGVLDLIDYVMKGDDALKRTWPLDGMKKSREGFAFTIVRKSACLAVDVKLKPELWPADFFKLKRKQKKKGLTEKEWEKLHEYMKNILLTFPVKSAKKLFGTPTPYKTLIWGTLKPSEIDQHVRALRRAKKKNKSPSKP